MIRIYPKLVKIYKNYLQKSIFYSKNNSYKINSFRQILSISKSSNIKSTEIIKYFGEFRPYKVVNSSNTSIQLKPIGISYWEYSNSEWAYDTIEWQDDNVTYTHIKKLGKIKNRRFRGY